MQDYFTFTSLIGVRQANLSVYRDARVQRYKSVEKMMDLIQIAKKTAPQLPLQCFALDQFDPEWDDLMPFPVVDHKRYIKLAANIGLFLWFYAYNYNTITASIRFRNFRNLFPFVIAGLVGFGYYKYRVQILKINLFDEYCFLRAQELVKQNEYLLRSEDFERWAWWKADFTQTMSKVYRQGNDNKASDFKDSELLLQDFVDRYVNPNDKSPMKKFATGL